MTKSPHLKIYTVRDQHVVLDSDLAAAYDVETRVFNQAFKRNAERFPEDFAFQLTHQELRNLISQSVTSSSHGGRRKLPWVFTEHGALMSATILNSENAIAMSVYVIRAFVEMRQQLMANATILKRLGEIEQTHVYRFLPRRHRQSSLRLATPPRRRPRLPIPPHRHPHRELSERPFAR